MAIEFHPFQTQHIPLWEKWVMIPHVKDMWFIPGYEPTDYIYEKIKGNGYDYPFAVYLDKLPIGYIQCCDLYAYRTICPKPKGLFTQEKLGTFAMDLFIADEDKLNQGLGTKIVNQFTDFIFEHYNANIILIDPASTNKRAIRCYEKAGFQFVKEAFDGVTMCTIMRKIK